MKNEKPTLYKEIKKTAIGRFVEMDSTVGRKIILMVYSVSQKIFGFN